MTAQTIAQITTALVLAHSVRALLEMYHVGSKVSRLSKITRQHSIAPYRINVNTRAKVYSLNLGVGVALFLMAYFIISVMNIGTNRGLVVSICSIIVVEVITIIGYDSYHIHMEKIMKFLIQ